MNDTAPLTQDEVFELFGEKLPMEAVDLLWNVRPDMTIEQLRSKLRAIAATRLKPEKEFVRSADGSETVVDDKEATIMNLIREGNRLQAKIERLTAVIMGIIAWIEQGGPPGLMPAEMVAELRRILEQKTDT